MFARLYTTGKEYKFTPDASHVINCTVNGVVAPFTVTDDEIHLFGLYSSEHKLLGYFGNQGLTLDRSQGIYTNGFMEPKVIDAPKGAYIKSVSKYHTNGLNYRKEVALH